MTLLLRRIATGCATVPPPPPPPPPPPISVRDGMQKPTFESRSKMNAIQNFLRTHCTSAKKCLSNKMRSILWPAVLKTSKFVHLRPVPTICPCTRCGSQIPVVLYKHLGCVLWGTAIFLLQITAHPQSRSKVMEAIAATAHVIFHTS